jgi:hypothetical protein
MESGLQPGGVPRLRQQTLGEIEPLLHVTHFDPELVEVLPEFHHFELGFTASAADGPGDGLADGTAGEHHGAKGQDRYDRNAERENTFHRDLN